jgi:nitrate/nitrite-specific signal transduction histidine kinase
VLRRHLGDRGIEVMRIVREAIGNARFHLGAGEIRVDAAGSTAQVLPRRGGQRHLVGA